MIRREGDEAIGRGGNEAMGCNEVREIKKNLKNIILNIKR